MKVWENQLLLQDRQLCPSCLSNDVKWRFQTKVTAQRQWKWRQFVTWTVTSFNNTVTRIFWRYFSHQLSVIWRYFPHQCSVIWRCFSFNAPSCTEARMSQNDVKKRHRKIWNSSSKQYHAQRINAESKRMLLLGSLSIVFYRLLVP